jgi:hypothetical protein
MPLSDEAWNEEDKETCRRLFINTKTRWEARELKVLNYAPEDCGPMEYETDPELEAEKHE